MFKVMKNKKREVSREVIDEILCNGEYGVLATLGDHGYPCVTPVNYVYLDNCIYFHCAIEGEKIDNIRRNSKVSFSVVNETKIIPEKFTTDFKSVVIYGEAREVEKKLKKKILTLLVKKYSGNYVESGEKYIEKSSDDARVIEVEIQHITGKVLEKQ